MISQLVFSISPFSTALWDLANSRPVHSLMLSSRLFLSLFTIVYNSNYFNNVVQSFRNQPAKARQFHRESIDPCAWSLPEISSTIWTRELCSRTPSTWQNANFLASVAVGKFLRGVRQIWISQRSLPCLSGQQTQRAIVSSVGYKKKKKKDTQKKDHTNENCVVCNANSYAVV